MVARVRCVKARCASLPGSNGLQEHARDTLYYFRNKRPKQKLDDASTKITIKLAQSI